MGQRGFSFLAVLSISLALLTGCNTTDALTPQVDVPNGGQVSSQPVTQSDLNSMANAPAPPSTMDTVYQTQPNSLQPGAGQTLDAQASRLNSQGQAVQSQTLQPPAQTPQQQTTPVQVPVQAASAGNGPAIRFLPIIGAPVASVTPLSKQLGNEAKARGLTIKSTTDPGTEHILKGYLNALTDGDKTVVVYVWDVLDSNGARLHRIQGQGSLPKVADDPWSVVPDVLMEKIATRTMDEYMAWRQTQ